MNQMRQDPVTGNWVVIIKPEEVIPSPQIAPSLCPFCEGYETMTPAEITAIRKEGTLPNTPGWEIRVVPCPDPVFRIEGKFNKEGEGLYNKMNSIGAHELIIETPEHNKQITQLSTAHIEKIFNIYRKRIVDLKQDSRFRYVFVYKNYGEFAGEIIDHPCSNVIATPITPRKIKEEFQGALEYYRFKERCVYCDILDFEGNVNKRVVLENAHFMAICPIAPRFQYETWIIPKTHKTFYEDSLAEYSCLAHIYREVLLRVKKVLNNPSYTVVLHSGPNLLSSRYGAYWKTIKDDYHWHLEIMPRPFRASGFQRISGFYLNAVSPEEASQRLRECLL